ncbi:MAG: hypothetical protein HQL26_00235 [Candidatus Omnitrophica bacterium]|nr:hypothetical protein [Candidatus Omnitrophota bacterium]
MEPFSMFGVILLSVAAGAVLSMVSKKPQAPVNNKIQSAATEKPVVQQQELVSEYTEEKVPGIIDAEKEKAIDDLIEKRS